MPRTLHRLMRHVRMGGATHGAHSPSWFESRRTAEATVGLPRDLLSDPGQTTRIDDRLKPLLDQPEVIAAIERDETPIPAPRDREGYFGDRHLSYWLSGWDDLQVVRRLAPAADTARILDFGGATGRFARHAALTHAAATVTIAELNVNHVNWVNEQFGPAVRAVKVSPYPHFPLGDRSISLCVGLSVFTHIDSYETGWLAEIHRVLQPGGYAFLTIHSEHTWSLLSTMPHLLKVLQTNRTFRALYDGGAPMPERRLVFDYNPESIEHNCNVFMHSNYLRRCWGKWFDVVGIHLGAHHGFQTAVVLRKRDSNG